MTTIAEALISKWTGTAAPAPTNLSKDEYTERLTQGVWTVDFTKVDGTPATMDVTLDPAIMPLTEAKTAATPRAEQPHLVHAYSTDRQGWRCFTIANVKSFRQSL